MSTADVLKSYVPPFIIQSKTFQAVYNVQGEELDRLNADVLDIISQCFIDTATWGLKYWEKFFGIQINESKETEYRRSVVKSKMRGASTVTVNLIQNVAESYENGEVDITENPSNYSFDVKFVGVRGIPPNLDDLKAAIEEIKPAHLAVTYTFTYITWDEFDTYKHQWDEWDKKNLTWNQFEQYKE